MAKLWQTEKDSAMSSTTNLYHNHERIDVVLTWKQQSTPNDDE